MILVCGRNLWRIFPSKWFPTVVQAVQLSELIQLCVIYYLVNLITLATAYSYSIIMSDDNSDSAPSNDTARGAGGVEKKAGLVNRSCGMSESSPSSNQVNIKTGGVSDPKGPSGDNRGTNSDDTDGLSSGNDSGERESEGGMERGSGSRGRLSNRSYQSSSSQNGKDSAMCLETTESNKRWERKSFQYSNFIVVTGCQAPKKIIKVSKVALSFFQSLLKPYDRFVWWTAWHLSYLLTNNLKSNMASKVTDTREWHLMILMSSLWNQVSKLWFVHYTELLYNFGRLVAHQSLFLYFYGAFFFFSPILEHDIPLSAKVFVFHLKKPSVNCFEEHLNLTLVFDLCTLSSNSHSPSPPSSSLAYSLLSASSEQDPPSTSGCSSDQSARVQTQKELMRALNELKIRLPPERKMKGRSSTLNALKYALTCVRQVRGEWEFHI